MVTVPRVANWDTAYGYELYCKGLSDGQIADECKVKISTVKAMRLNKWRKKPDGGRKEMQNAECGMQNGLPRTDDNSALCIQHSELTGKEVAGVDEQKERKQDIARMMEVIAKMTSGMGGIKAVCIGNVIQALWNCSSVDDIREAMSILGWMEENYDFG